MSDKKVKQSLIQFLIYTTILSILFLSAINVNTSLRPKVKILGVETSDNDQVFWSNFITLHPNYLPGWIELGRTEKVREIDPNYKKLDQ